MYLYMHSKISDFRTLLKSFETTSLIIIGKLNLHIKIKNIVYANLIYNLIFKRKI